ncbi:hypothetical protein [uncultured Desulfosarcina sp.]|uniref:hypothetical protein n=1 Tax=uncultured Desulfosarcina sp. TaxID=218289 RepID=UPI0029C843FE|nr:hypothetical protein [uncultured Desulfosarcina sp.]
MKKVKIALWILIFGFVGLLIFQNRGFFMAESRLMLDLGFFYYETPFLANAIFFVAFFLAGMLITYFFGLFRQFRDAKTIKTLKAKEASLVETVSSLEKRLSKPETTAAPADVKPIVEEESSKTTDEVQ